MFTKNLRNTLIAVCLAASFYSMNWGNKSFGFACFIIALVFVYGYFRNGSVFVAWLYFRKGRLRKARAALDETGNPKWLSRKCRWFYYFLNGGIDMEIGDWVNAEGHLQTALMTGTKKTHNDALLRLNLAKLYLIEGDIERARTQVNKAKHLKHHVYLDPIIEDINTQINRGKLSDKRNGV